MHSQNHTHNPNGNGGNGWLRSATSSRSSQFLQAPREARIPLPHHRLSPLINNEEPLPEAPFTMKLATVLTWGKWRPFPTRETPQQLSRTNDAFLTAATSPGAEELLMMVGTMGQSAHQTIRIRPQRKGTAVSVSDVIEAVEAVWHNTQHFVSVEGITQSSVMIHDGKLFWRGLKIEEDDDGTVILVLRA